MSMISDLRDTASSLYYLKALEALRERHLEMSLREEEVPADYWEKGEAEALAATKREFFNSRARRIFFPEEAEDRTDDEDFRSRSTEMMEMGMLETHRILTGIPWVGHPDYQDPEAESRDRDAPEADDTGEEPGKSPPNDGARVEL